MHTFEFIRPADPAAAINTAAQSKTAQQGADVRFLGGGTTLLDLMKLNVETPTRVLDINRLPLDSIEDTSDGGLKIGATVRNSDLANHSREYCATMPCCPRRFFPARRGRSATWPQPPATWCRERGVSISATRRCPAISANREPAAPAITGSNRTLAILGNQRSLHRHQPVGYVRGHGSTGGSHPRARDPRGHAAIPI